MKPQPRSFTFGLALFAGLALQTACSSEQLKANTYDALHRHQQIKCQEEGRADCPGYEAYPEYEKKQKEAQQEMR